MNPKSDKMQDESSDQNEDATSFKPETTNPGLIPSEQQYIPGVAVSDLKSKHFALKKSDTDAKKIAAGFKNSSSSSSKSEDSHEKSDRPSPDSSKNLSKDFERPYHHMPDKNKNPDFRTDGLKIYPTLVIRGTGLYELWKQGKYRNYHPTFLIDLVAKILSMVPPWVRIYRFFFNNKESRGIFQCL